MALRFFGCQQCCLLTEVEVNKQQLLQEVLGNEQDGEDSQDEVVIYTTGFEDDLPAFAKPVLLGTQGMTNKKRLHVPIISGWERVATSEHNKASSIQKGTPPCSTRSCSRTSLSLRFSPRPESLSPGGSCKSSSRSNRADFPITSYRLNEDDPESELSRHVAFAPSRDHSVHQSEYSVIPYGEIYGQHPGSFDLDREGNMVACQLEVDPEDDGKHTMNQQLNNGPPGAICFDD